MIPLPGDCPEAGVAAIQVRIITAITASFISLCLGKDAHKGVTMKPGRMFLPGELDRLFGSIGAGIASQWHFR